MSLGIQLARKIVLLPKSIFCQLVHGSPIFHGVEAHLSTNDLSLVEQNISWLMFLIPPVVYLHHMLLLN